MLFALLLTLPFVSKISFNALRMLPDRFSVLWWQGGLHPIMNSLLSLVLLLALAWSQRRKRWPRDLSAKMYFTGLLLLLAVLGTQSVLQGVFEELNVSLDLHFIGLLLSFFLLLGYGWLLPRASRVEEIFNGLTLITRILMFASIVVLFLRPETAFKGTRFIGIFKHIPYMVTCSQIALLVEWKNLACRQGRQRGFAVFFLLLALGGIGLTGTRSAALCGLAFLALALIKWPVRTSGLRWTRRFALYLAAVFSLSLGPFAVAGVESLLRGESSFLMRPAQDGIASRAEEVERGLATLRLSPWLGQGLLHRFGSESMETAGSYNSFRDPHNLFVSAGVIGGWPLVAAISAGFAALVLFLSRKLLSPSQSLNDYPLLLLNIYLFSHVPILFVYHVHLSLGGLADRLYWLFMGCVFTLNGAAREET